MNKIFDDHIETTNITTEMKNCYIDYAMSVIIGRALPDVRDGMKPVHRRILYAMNELGLYPERPFRKCVRIVGDVLGKYHPHGDASVYDALVRMAQDFSTRYPTVKGHGNFGSIDGDSAAAMRYTEAKMDEISKEMLRDINKNTVDFIDNFDGSESEPEVLTARFPHLLVNGSSGIAVGMATNMPPHNLGEVIDATIAYIDNPNISVEELLDYLPGPDFPTEGIIVGNEGIREAYQTGHGKIKVRGRARIEPGKRGKSEIIITELPYNVNKAKLIEKIAQLHNNKRIEGITEIRDETDLKQGIKIVIDLKKGIDANYVLSQLYKLTDLENTFGITNLALVPDSNKNLHPKVLSLPQILGEYTKHQKEVIVRRTQFDLNKAEKRAHIVEGLLIALDNIDEVIDTIRRSKNGQTANKNLQKKFKLTEIQAQAILDMRLQRLTALERTKLKNEYKELQKQIAYFKKILSDEKEVFKVVKDELQEIKEKYSDERRTEILTEFKEQEYKEPKKELVTTISHKGYINSKPADSKRKFVLNEDDRVAHNFEMTNHDNLLIITNKGRAYKLRGKDLPETRDRGVYFGNLFNLSDGESIIETFKVSDFNNKKQIAMATKSGMVKRTSLKEFDNQQRAGVSVVNLKGDDELRSAILIPEEGAEVVAASKKGNVIRFDLKDINPTSRASLGVKGIGLQKDDELINMDLSKTYAVTITNDGNIKATKVSDYNKQNRGGKGLKNINHKGQEIIGFITVDDPVNTITIETEDDNFIEAGNIPIVTRTKLGINKTDKKIRDLYIFDTNV